MMTKRKQTQPKRNDDAIDFDYDNVQQQQQLQQPILKQHLASAQLTDCEAQNDFALAAPDTANQNEANQTTAECLTENGCRVELVKQDLFSSLVKSANCKRTLEQRACGGDAAVVGCLAENSNSVENIKDGSCHGNTDEINAVILDYKVSTPMKVKLSRMEQRDSDDEDFVQCQKRGITFDEKAMESDELPVQLKSIPVQFHAKAKLLDVKPGQPNKFFWGENVASVNPTCNTEVADGFDDDSVKSNSKANQTTDIGSDLVGVLHTMMTSSSCAKSDSVFGHRTEDETVVASSITDFPWNKQSTLRPKSNRNLYSFGEGHQVSSDSSSTEESANFVKKLESFVASVAHVSSENHLNLITCHKKSQLQEKTTCIPSYVDKCCQVLAPVSGHLNWNTTSFAQQPPAITNANVIDADRPLDLSSKINSNSPLVSSYSWSMLFNSGNADSSELSSLARLEEKFGAKSAILDQVGVWPSNRVLSSKSRLPFSDGHPGLTVQEESTRSLSWKVTTTKALSFSKDRRSGSQSKYLLESSGLSADGNRRSTDCAGNAVTSLCEMLHADNSLRSISVRRNSAVSSGLLRYVCGVTSEEETLSQLTGHPQDHGCLTADISAAGVLHSEMVHGEQSAWLSQRHQDLHSILHCIECGLLFQSLSELTVHMFQMAHYLNLVHPDAMVHQQRPSSVCSASTLDSFDGNENSSSEQSGCDSKDKLLHQTPLWQDLYLLSQVRENACSSSAAENVQPLKTKPGHKRSRLNCNSSERTDFLNKVQRQDPCTARSSDNEYHIAVKQVFPREDHCGAAASDANSDSICSSYISPISGNDFETCDGQNMNNKNNSQSQCLDPEEPWSDNGLSPDGSRRNVSALVAMQNFVQQSFLSDQTPFLSRADTICDKEMLSQSLENNPTQDVRCQLSGSSMLKKTIRYSSNEKQLQNQLLMDSRKSSDNAAKICLNLSQSQNRKTRNCRWIIRSQRSDESPDSCVKRKNTSSFGNKSICESL